MIDTKELIPAIEISCSTCRYRTSKRMCVVKFNELPEDPTKWRCTAHEPGETFDQLDPS